jgi:DNA polymerase elongation subunit (family B)
MTAQPSCVFDVETYRNFFLVLFKDLASGVVTRFQISPNRRLDVEGLRRVLRTNLLIGFNSAEYDLPMIQLALKGYSAEMLKNASDDIIGHGMKPSDFREKYGVTRANWNHVDLINVAPLKASLKLYAGRLHCQKMQDLPIDPGATITAEQAEQLVTYCCNDLDNTALLYGELAGQVALRETLSKEYKQDLRSRSDAQIAEHVIVAEVKKLNGGYVSRPEIAEGTEYKYHVPDFISYRSAPLRAMLQQIRDATYMVGAAGKIELPSELTESDICIGGGKYRMGLGGLHSSEKRVMHEAGASYYPSIILNLGLYPKHMGEAFLTVYRSLVTRRVAAKKAGDKVTAESLKIAVNGGGGKFASKYSAMYAPDLLIQMTISGQLSLLMLIEMVELAGLPVLSANTDGIIIKCHKELYPIILEVIAEWERLTGFSTEETLYSAVYSKDVNNYIAIKLDGKVKGKGLYSNPWESKGPNIFKFHKNPSTTIVIEAMIALLRDNIPLAVTVRACRDITKFIAVRSVTGGANKENGVYLGKAVRWYYATEGRGKVLNYAKSGNKVPKTDGAKPLMELPDEFPSDVNYDWYIAEAMAALNSIGYGQRTLWT